MKLIDASARELTEFRIPGGEMPVRLVTLHADPEGDRWSLIEFPAGFRRPVAGAFRAEEEFLVIDGDVIINGMTFLPGDHVYVPGSLRRESTMSDVGLLAVSWFSDSPGWFEREDGIEPDQARIVRTHWEHLPAIPGPLGEGRVMRDGPVVSWILEDGPRGTADRRTALFSLTDLSFAWVEPREEFPRMVGPVFARS